MRKLLYLLCILFIFSMIYSLANPPKVKELQTNDYQLQVITPPKFTIDDRNTTSNSSSTRDYSLNLDKQAQTLDFLTNNTGICGDFKHLRLYPKNYMSEAIRLYTPEMEEIFLNNKKTQKEYQDWGTKNNLSTYKLYPGQIIKISGRKFSMQNYIMNWGDIEKDLIKKGNVLIGTINDEVRKYDLINEKAEPYFKAIESADEVLRFYELDPEVISPSKFGMPKSRREYYTGAQNRRNKAIKKLKELRLTEKLNNQSTILKGLEKVNNNYIELVEEFRLKKFSVFAASLNHRAIDEFIASYKNTILSWTGDSKDLSSTYSFAFRDKLNIKTDGLNKINLLLYYFIKFGSILPYLFLILTIYATIIIWKKSKS